MTAVSESRLLPSVPITAYAEHLRSHGQLPGAATRSFGKSSLLITEVERSGLTGRGGAAFPAGRKLRSVADATSWRRRGVVIANGAESEPASAKDRTLLRMAPHLVFDGMEVACAAVGASQAYLCVADPGLADFLWHVAASREWEAGVEVVHVPHRYVASESSSLVNFLNGGEPLPMYTPPRMSGRGVGGRPTLISNVETLAHIAVIARHGAGWFRRVGSASSPGTMLVTVSGAVRSPGVFEVPCGSPVAEAVALAGGVASGKAGPILQGGYFGTWAAGLSGVLTSSVLAVLPEDACGLEVTARLLRRLAGESAGQCGPCLNGLPALAAAFEAAVTGGASPAAVEGLGRLIEGRGACHLPDGATRLAASALRVFAADIRRHSSLGRCAS